jgi:hypothetical protein
MTVEPLMMMMMMILLATFMAAVTNFTPIAGERIKSAIIFLHHTLNEILLKSLTGFIRLYHGCQNLKKKKKKKDDNEIDISSFDTFKLLFV